MKRRGWRRLDAARRAVLVAAVAVTLPLCAQSPARACAAAAVTTATAVPGRTCVPQLQPVLAQDPALQPCHPVAAAGGPGAAAASARVVTAEPSGGLRASTVRSALLAGWSEGGLPLLLGAVVLLLGLALVLLAWLPARPGVRTRR